MTKHDGYVGRLSIQLQEEVTEREVQLRLYRKTKKNLGPTLVASANNKRFGDIAMALLTAALDRETVEVKTTGTNPPQIRRVTVNP